MAAPAISTRLGPAVARLCRALALTAAAAPYLAGCASVGIGTGVRIGEDEEAPTPAAAAGVQPVVTTRAVAGPRYYLPATGADDARLAAELGAILAAAGEVQRAYLARVREGEGPEVLTVCIAARAPVSDDVVRAIGGAYATTHGTSGVLDVVELERSQERMLARTVAPFYGTPMPNEETGP